MPELDTLVPLSGANPDLKPGSPNAADDEFDATDTSDPITGWTTFGSLDSLNTNSGALSHLYMRKTAVGGASVSGLFKANPALPFTMTAKLAGFNASNYGQAGIFVAEAAPSTGKLKSVALFNDSGRYGAIPLRGASVVAWTNRTTYGVLVDTHQFSSPLWLRIIAASSTDVTFQASHDGLLYFTCLANDNPGFTIGAVGLMVNSDGSIIESLFDWIRFT